MPIKILREGPAPWGDYGHILMHGMAAHSGIPGDLRLHLERTGPFLPPITFPGIGDIVVTDAFRRLLEQARFAGLSFQPVYKERIVDLLWEGWDRTADLPPEMPETGEPEDFILERQHSPQVSDLLGDLWEVILPVAASVERVPRGTNPRDTEIRLRLDVWASQDLFRATGVLYNYASERAQDWFFAHVPDCVAFEECAVK